MPLIIQSGYELVINDEKYRVSEVAHKIEGDMVSGFMLHAFSLLEDGKTVDKKIELHVNIKPRPLSIDELKGEIDFYRNFIASVYPDKKQ